MAFPLTKPNLAIAIVKGPCSNADQTEPLPHQDSTIPRRQTNHLVATWQHGILSAL